MPDDRIRIELAFKGGQIIAALVSPATADAVEQAVTAGAGGTIALDSNDGRITAAVAQVVYLKRYTRGAQPGFLASD